jgi:preprotein translocase subunit Sec63
MQLSSLDPFENLGLKMPSYDVDSMFNSKEVKKAYRKLAVKYHPDKVHLLPEEERLGAPKKWLLISKSYECLTDETKYQNWKEYGNPDGSVVSQTLDLALPSWMFEEENQIIVLCLFLLFFVLFPLLIIANIKSASSGPERFDNGIEKETQQIMMAFFFESLTRNMKKKVKVFTDD